MGLPSLISRGDPVGVSSILDYLSMHGLSNDAVKLEHGNRSISFHADTTLANAIRESVRYLADIQSGRITLHTPMQANPNAVHTPLPYLSPSTPTSLEWNPVWMSNLHLYLAEANDEY
jgi:hypothetical protein